MNRLEYYDRQKEAWEENEVNEIIDEYNTKEMTICQLADIHRRTPGSISYKLKNIGVIQHNTMSRGYSEYKSSDLYKEVVEKGKIADSEKKIKKETKPVKEIKKVTVETIGLATLLNEINELKRDVKEMLSLMNSLYDFETTSIH